MAIEKAKPRSKKPADPSVKKRGIPAKKKQGLIAPGSGAALFAIAFAAACGVGYAWTQHASREGLAGEIQRQWRSGELGAKRAGALAYASGDIEGLTVSDPQFALTARAAVIERAVSTYQWVENCSRGPCSVEMGWREGVLDASAFKTPGKANIAPRYQSMAMAGRVRIGTDSLAASASRQLASLGKPYPVGQADAEIAGLSKVDGGYQNFQGEPKLGDFRVTWRALAIGAPVTVIGERDASGDIVASNGRRFAAREGILSAPEFLDLTFWELPEFGWMLLGLGSISLALGVGGLVSAKRLEERKIKLAAGGAPQAAPDEGVKRTAPSRGLAKPKEYRAAAERRARMAEAAHDAKKEDGARAARQSS